MSSILKGEDSTSIDVILKGRIVIQTSQITTYVIYLNVRDVVNVYIYRIVHVMNDIYMTRRYCSMSIPFVDIVFVPVGPSI